MDENRYGDELFEPADKNEGAVQENFATENTQDATETEEVSAEKAEEFIPLKSTDEAINEAGFEPAQEEKTENTSFLFQEYPRPVVPPYQAQQEEAPAEEPLAAAPEFNPYAPRENASEQPQVNPAYGQINQNAYGQYQQNPHYGAPSQNTQYSPYNQHTQNFTPPEPPKKSKGKGALGVILVVCLAIAVIGLLAGIFGDKTPKAENTTTTAPYAGEQMPTTQTQGATELPAAESTTQNIEVSSTEPTTQVTNSVYVAEKVRPSVVGVMTYYEGKLAGEGSGVLMSEKDGWTYIVTCAHVISEDGVTYGVMLLDGRTFEAKLVAYDERTDIGVVKVEATGLPIAEFGDSTNLKVGEPVYAIGNPGGSEYFGSITNGIISAIDRSVTSTYTMTCIQHNAAINPGNSGGALVNASGQVIGINSSKIASTEYEGMGFAVPTSIASPVVDALVNYGYVPNRPKLGIEYAPVSSYQLYSLVVSIKGLPQGSLVIAGISEDSSLADTEAEVGDLIVAVNGEDMDDSSVLLDLIETGAVGDTLTLTLCRIESRTYKTSTFDVTITLVEDKGTTQQETTVPATEYQDDGYYRGGSDNFDDFFNDYFGW